MGWNPDNYLDDVFRTFDDKQENVSKREMEILVKRYCGVSRDKTVTGIIRRWVDFGFLVPTDNVYVFRINYRVKEK